jgi:hypothetical protein
LHFGPLYIDGLFIRGGDSAADQTWGEASDSSYLLLPEVIESSPIISTFRAALRQAWMPNSDGTCVIPTAIVIMFSDVMARKESIRKCGAADGPTAVIAGKLVRAGSCPEETRHSHRPVQVLFCS